MTSLIPVADALARLLAQAGSISALETLPLTQGLGRILAADQHAAVDVPAYDNSAVDGYALRVEDLPAPGVTLAVSQIIAAGHPGLALEPGSAARIFTGAPIPPGANAVVMQEDTRAEGNQVNIMELPVLGQHIRGRGHDIRAGQQVLARGRRLLAQDLGLLASLGLTEIPVFKPLTVAILTTGDEVVPPGQPLEPGQLHDSNSYILQGLLQGLGMQVLRKGIVGDDLNATRQALSEAAAEADCVISTGGVSVGAVDHVKAAVEALGALDLWRLAIKPGKPFSFGHIGDTPFFGLPGNPVAVFVTWLVLVRAYLLKLQGACEVQLPMQTVCSGFALAPGSRQEYQRVRLQYQTGELPIARPFDDQGSSLLSSLSWADGLVVIPRGVALNEGDALDYIPFRGAL
ncbi:MAG: molybdopterin molybdotransferase MoeA [Pseudomonadales bacterium]|nr:molybdopterin molybdotransferase MoeA [Pseudomonadales bacterium]